MESPSLKRPSDGALEIELNSLNYFAELTEFVIVFIVRLRIFHNKTLDFKVFKIN